LRDAGETPAKRCENTPEKKRASPDEDAARIGSAPRLAPRKKWRAAVGGQISTVQCCATTVIRHCTAELQLPTETGSTVLVVFFYYFSRVQNCTRSGMQNSAEIMRITPEGIDIPKQ
jgi:hypothetical protein